MPIDLATRRTLVNEARALVMANWPSINPHASCLHVAAALIGVAWVKLDYRLTLQAGSAFWVSTSPEHDDGVSPNRFGYLWEPHSNATLRARLENRLPELHAWAFDPSNGDIIDLTTGSWPTQALDLGRMPWKAPQPPNYWWGPSSELPEGAEYRASQSASAVAAKCLQRELGL
jgi:hypothetical protein